MTSNFIWRGVEGYDAYMGRWSRRLAPLFLDFAGAGPGELKDVFAKAGFVGIADTVLTIRMDFANFDDYWNPLITGQGNLEEFVASMPKHTREQVQSGVRAAYLCNKPDGPRSFAGVAWAVSGIVPAG